MARPSVHVLWLILLHVLFLCNPLAGCGKAGGEKGLTPDERGTLRHIAQTTVACVVRGETVPSFPIQSSRLKEPRGAFVTLTTGGRLRGCIGSLVGVMPLHETVRKMAVQAATRDPRFPPVSPQELSLLEIEISVISPLRPVQHMEEIVVGTHGLVLVHGNRSGVLLPQVASDYGWDRETFLEQLSQKAGLPNDAWKSPKAQLYAFTAEVF